MKTKSLCAAFLLFGISMSYGQLVQSSTETGVGTENGAYQNVTSNGVFAGYQAGKVTTGANNTMVGHQAGLANTTYTNNCFFGAFAGSANLRADNTYIGNEAGRYIQTGEGNVLLGSKTMSNTLSTSGSYNTILGYFSGNVNRGASNVFVGVSAGSSNTTGGGNTFNGAYAGNSNTTGEFNVYLGQNSGQFTTGSRNTYLGTASGTNNTGSDNVFIGHGAGFNATGSNKLYINNTHNDAMIYGDFSTKKVSIGGVLNYATSDGFPTTSGSVNVSNFRLFVTGGILTEEVRVHLKTGWADYVFNKNYKLPTLLEVEQFIKTNGHLPNVPSAERVAEDGIGLGEMSKIQQEKIEELTLYAIEQDKKVEAQNLQLQQQQKEIDELKAAVKALMQKQ